MSKWADRVKQRGCLRIGHRGAAALEPQNTLRAFQRALDLGVDAIEFDVRWTADRQLVIVHSEDLAETTNGQGKVCERSLAELRALDAGQGERIPTLDETLELLKDKALMVVDLKLAGHEEDVLQAIMRHGVQDDVLICSGTPASLRRVRELAQDVLTAISYPEDTGGASTKPYLSGVVSVALAVMRAALPWRIHGMMAQAQADAAMLYHRLLTSAVIQAIHGQGKLVGAWTVDTADAIHRVREMGVDSITSNRPDLL